MGTPTSLALKAGLGGPWSKRIRRRYGVDGFSQFTGAQLIAEKWGFSREQLDQYALKSHQRAAAATYAGAFLAEIVPLEVNGESHVVDEGIRFDATAESIGSVKLLRDGGVLSAANASQVCDGSAGPLRSGGQ
jgi:acetyl-CoA C-acetyltransferase